MPITAAATATTAIATSIRRDRTWIFGIVLLLLSLLFFGLPAFIDAEDATGGFFICNYALVIAYFFTVLATGRLKRGGNGLPLIFVVLVLALVSCYALNRSIPLFETSATWWWVLLAVCCGNYLTILFYDQLPRPLQYLVCAIAGISLIAFLYLSIYLMPAYLMCAFASPALGLSLHVFIPILFVIYTLVFFIRAARSDRRVLYAFLSGIAFSILFTAQYTIRWGARVGAIQQALYEAEQEPRPAAPRWVAVAQSCPPSNLVEHVLKAGLVYDVSSTDKFRGGFFGLPSRRFNEERQHDPLVMIAAFFQGRSDLEDNERIKILECIYDSRHQAQERLWTGIDLKTTRVETHAELWPRLHLSYTEENITVANSALRNAWSSQEAIYTFHLPEGAVVSSLSLWIDGREQKGILSSRHMADSAYRTIVGYEQRDPSVVHWQEGDRVVVRVFPVRPQESRHFKIGITAPLEKDKDRLTYQSIYFDGPPAGGAASVIDIRPMQPINSLSPSGPLQRKGTYDPGWRLQFDDPGIADAGFRFNGRQYTTDTHIPTYATADIRTFFLDLNGSWSHDDFSAVLDQLRGKHVYAWLPDKGLISLSSANCDQVFQSARTLQFSLFPLDQITDRERSLLISKSSASSPSLSDLSGSGFSDRLQKYLEQPGKIRVFSLSAALSPYLQALKECGAFRIEKGDLATLQQRLRENRFLTDSSSPGQVPIDPAGLLIRCSDSGSATHAVAAATPPATATPASASTAAPDHLLRLFAYSQIMQHMNGRLPGDFPSDDPTAPRSLEQTAREAGIVSPVSSLVVLERQADYDRFDIAASKAGLQNASLQSKGAVPEPGDWALFFVVITLFIFIRLHYAKRAA